MLEDLDKDWILQKIRESTQFSSRVVGDTPTDANQLVPKKYVDGRIASIVGTYGGKVNSNGTSAGLPTGWSSTSTGTGQYQVTHNLGTTSYATSAMVQNGNQRTVFIADLSANTVEYWVRDTSGVAQNNAINFLLTPIV